MSSSFRMQIMTKDTSVVKERGRLVVPDKVSCPKHIEIQINKNPTLTNQMCVMFMYVCVCSDPDPKRDAEDNGCKESQKSSSCIVL